MLTVPSGSMGGSGARRGGRGVVALLGRDQERVHGGDGSFGSSVRSRLALVGWRADGLVCTLARVVVSRATGRLRLYPTMTPVGRDGRRGRPLPLPVPGGFVPSSGSGSKCGGRCSSG